MSSGFRYYRAIFWRRLPLFMAVVLSITGIAFFVGQRLPVTYEASARLLLESAQIPDQLAMSTATTGGQEQLEIIQQRLLTRANMLDIAERFDVYDDMGIVSPDEIVDRMRGSTTIRLTAGRNRATLMNLTFTDDNARTTSDVVNEYVTLIQREDSRLRTSRASETEEFFQQEVERLELELDRRSDAIRDFRSENADALPETFTFRLDRLADLQQRATDYTRDLLILNEQRKQLNDAETARQEALSENASAELTNEQERLVVLREELADAMRDGDASSPRIRILRSRIQQVEQVIQSLGGLDVGTAPTETAEALIEQIDAQLEFLGDQLDVTNAEIADIENTLDRTQGISVQLDSLRRDYENAQQQYNRAVERQSIAQTSERIELASRGQRITVLEQAATPTTPSSAPRVLVTAGGIAAGIALGFGVIILLEVLNRTIRRPADLVNALGVAPLATLPYVRTQREMFLDRTAKGAFILLLLGGIPAALYAVHLYYLPLDLLAERVLNKIGV